MSAFQLLELIQDLAQGDFWLLSRRKKRILILLHGRFLLPKAAVLGLLLLDDGLECSNGTGMLLYLAV